MPVGGPGGGMQPPQNAIREGRWARLTPNVDAFACAQRAQAAGFTGADALNTFFSAHGAKTTHKLIQSMVNSIDAVSSATSRLAARAEVRSSSIDIGVSRQDASRKTVTVPFGADARPHFGRVCGLVCAIEGLA